MQTENTNSAPNNAAILSPFETYDLHLCEIINTAMEPMRLFFDTIQAQEEHGAVAAVGEALFERAKFKIEEALVRIESDLGNVILTSLLQNADGRHKRQFVK